MTPIDTLRCSEYYQHVMQPIADDAPCGENLDYDPAFIMLLSRLQPKLAVEYGSFVEAAETINWTEIERECLALLKKSKDIRLIIILMRCRLRKIGISALAEGTEALYAMLCTWPDHLYPQLLDEGEFAPILRANAFAELEDFNGLLVDFRYQRLPKASGHQITIKEFEKAHQLPREEGALSDAAVAALVQEWQISAREAIRPLLDAQHFMQEITTILIATLGDDAPEFAVLLNILGLFSPVFDADTALAKNATQHTAEPQPQASVPARSNPPQLSTAVSNQAANSPNRPVPLPASPLIHSSINNRDDALQRLQEIRRWFVLTEPSSPLVQMLKHAEDSIGKNFTELLKMYPSEIVVILNQEKE